MKLLLFPGSLLALAAYRAARGRTCVHAAQGRPQARRRSKPGGGFSNQVNGKGLRWPALQLDSGEGAHRGTGDRAVHCPIRSPAGRHRARRRYDGALTASRNG